MSKYFKSYIDFSKGKYGQDTSENKPYQISKKELNLGAQERQAEALENQTDELGDIKDSLSSIASNLEGLVSMFVIILIILGLGLILKIISCVSH